MSVATLKIPQIAAGLSSEGVLMSRSYIETLKNPKFWLQQLGLNLLTGTLLTVFFSSVGASSLSPRYFLGNIWAGFIIGLPCQVLIPWVANQQFSSQWFRQLAVAIAAAIIAGVAAFPGAFGWLLVYSRPLDRFWQMVQQMWAGSVAIAVLISCVATYIGEIQWRLQRERAEREKAERLAAEARLASLESRLQPHFLFNTLNSISALIPESPQQAEQLVEQVSRLLRQSLDSEPNRLVKLGDELKLVNDYLSIERARFGDRLRFVLKEKAELNEAPVPAFALQVLVENAVKHSVAKRREGGTITVSSRELAQGFEVSVHDDGPGFSEADLKPGHAFDTLRNRLLSIYSTAASLRIDNAATAGITVRLQLPWITQ
jgi:signal transduction histidine kinase